MIDHIYLGAIIVVVQSICLTIFNLSSLWQTQHTCLFTHGIKASVCVASKFRKVPKSNENLQSGLNLCNVCLILVQLQRFCSVANLTSCFIEKANMCRSEVVETCSDSAEEDFCGTTVVRTVSPLHPLS